MHLHIFICLFSISLLKVPTAKCVLFPGINWGLTLFGPCVVCPPFDSLGLHSPLRLRLKALAGLLNFGPFDFPHGEFVSPLSNRGPPWWSPRWFSTTLIAGVIGGEPTYWGPPREAAFGGDPPPRGGFLPPQLWGATPRLYCVVTPVSEARTLVPSTGGGGG